MRVTTERFVRPSAVRRFFVKSGFPDVQLSLRAPRAAAVRLEQPPKTIIAQLVAQGWQVERRTLRHETILSRPGMTGRMVVRRTYPGGSGAYVIIAQRKAELVDWLLCDQAQRSTTGLRHAQIVKRELKRLSKILHNDLPACYFEGGASPAEAFEAFQFDWGADFSHNAEMSNELRACLRDKNWRDLASQVKAKHGYDFVQVANDCLSDKE